MIDKKKHVHYLYTKNVHDVIFSCFSHFDTAVPPVPSLSTITGIPYVHRTHDMTWCIRKVKVHVLVANTYCIGDKYHEIMSDDVTEITMVYVYRQIQTASIHYRF